MEKSLSDYIALSKNIDDLKYDKKLKVAILSSFTLIGLSETLHVKCSDLGIRYQSYLGGYNQYNQELLNSKSKLYNFSPDVTFLLIDIRNFFGNSFHSAHNISNDERKFLAKEKINELENLIHTFENNSKSKLVMTTLDVPSYSPSGIIETKLEFGFHEMIEEINNSLRQKLILLFMSMIFVNSYQNLVKKIFLITDNFILVIYK